jgi:hypothetical protein
MNQGSQEEELIAALDPRAGSSVAMTAKLKLAEY